MKKFLLTVMMLFVVIASFADDRYSSLLTPNGTLIFVKPHKLGVHKGIDKTDYDMTMLTWNDSVTINFTFRSKAMTLPTDLRLEYCGKNITCTDYSPLYVDLAKDGYEIRMTSKYPVSAVIDAIGCVAPFRIAFMQDGEAKYCSDTEGAWKKDRKTLLKILGLYNLHKK